MGSGHTFFGGSLTFDHRRQEWDIFKSRLSQYCTANDITEETDKSGVKRRALLLSALVEDTYRVVRDFFLPKDLEKVEYKDLSSELNDHFVTKRSSFAERFKFYKAEQRPGEDLEEWAARVRSLALHCEFNSELQTALRDRFVLGLENVREKEKLFAESINTLTFAKALELMQGPCAGPGQPAPAQPVFAMRAAAGTGINRRAQTQAKKCCSVCGYNNHDKEHT